MTRTTDITNKPRNQRTAATNGFYLSGAQSAQARRDAHERNRANCEHPHCDSSHTNEVLDKISRQNALIESLTVFGGDPDDYADLDIEMLDEWIARIDRYGRLDPEVTDAVTSEHGFMVCGQSPIVEAKLCPPESASGNYVDAMSGALRLDYIEDFDSPETPRCGRRTPRRFALEDDGLEYYAN